MKIHRKEPAKTKQNTHNDCTSAFQKIGKQPAECWLILGEALGAGGCSNLGADGQRAAREIFHSPSFSPIPPDISMFPFLGNLGLLLFLPVPFGNLLPGVAGRGNRLSPGVPRNPGR